METMANQEVIVQTTIKAPVERVWKCWTTPADITKWCQASDDWHAPHAENDLRAGGKFSTTMAAKDGSASFDFGGTYDRVEDRKLIEYTLGDGRKVSISFEDRGSETTVTETFEAEGVHPVDFQRDGWQAILDNFRKHVEQLS